MASVMRCCTDSDLLCFHSLPTQDAHNNSSIASRQSTHRRRKGRVWSIRDTVPFGFRERYLFQPGDTFSSQPVCPASAGNNDGKQENKQSMCLGDSPLDQVQSALRLDDAAHLSRLQRKGGLLKLLLHVSLAKVAQVASLAGTAAVALGQGEFAEVDIAALDAGLVGLDDLAGIVLGASDLALAPRGGAARVAVLDEQVGGADLVGGLSDGGAGRGCAVVGGHVLLELLRVGARRRLPA